MRWRLSDNSLFVGSYVTILFSAAKIVGYIYWWAALSVRGRGYTAINFSCLNWFVPACVGLGCSGQKAKVNHCPPTGAKNRADAGYAVADERIWSHLSCIELYLETICNICVDQPSPSIPFGNITLNSCSTQWFFFGATHFQQRRYGTVVPTILTA